MNLRHTLLFFTSLIVFTSLGYGQEDTVVLDSITYTEDYGLRVGIDLSKPIRTLVDEDYTGLEVLGDYRILKNYFLAAELGNETSNYIEENLNASTSGSYIKVGANYNTYNNWIGMSNEIFAGLRYGISTFKQELNSYSIYTDSPYFPPTVINDPIEYGGLTASWAELQLGIKSELFSNFYLSVHVQMKRKFGEDRPNNFDNLFIPGFGRTYDDSFFGVGYGYSLSYLIPITKKTEKQKNFGKQ